MTWATVAATYPCERGEQRSRTGGRGVRVGPPRAPAAPRVAAASARACAESVARDTPSALAIWAGLSPRARRAVAATSLSASCLLYTSDAADEEDSVDLGGR